MACANSRAAAFSGINAAGSAAVTFLRGATAVFFFEVGLRVGRPFDGRFDEIGRFDVGVFDFLEAVDFDDAFLNLGLDAVFFFEIGFFLAAMTVALVSMDATRKHLQKNVSANLA